MVKKAIFALREGRGEQQGEGNDLCNIYSANREGEVCYICKTNIPANFSDAQWLLYRGLCIECHMRIQNLLTLYQLERGGYVR